MANGGQAGVRRVIASNTNTSLTLASAFGGGNGNVRNDSYRIILPSGSATAATQQSTTSTLTDSTGWFTSSLVNSIVAITSGTGAGQVRTVAGVTSAQLRSP